MDEGYVITHTGRGEVIGTPFISKWKNGIEYNKLNAELLSTLMKEIEEDED